MISKLFKKGEKTPVRHDTQNTASPARAVILSEARALRQPSSSLYTTCLRERMNARQSELTILDRALDEVRAQGFAAAVRLLTLDAEEPTVFSAYTDLLGKGGV